MGRNARPYRTLTAALLTAPLTVSLAGLGPVAYADVVDQPAVGTVLAVEPQTVLVQRVERRVVMRLVDGSARVSPKGTDLFRISALGSFDVPEAALRAYENAAARTASTDPACQIPWTLLAGIGRVESDHGRYGGSQLGEDGVSRPRIIGLPLNGVGPVAAIPDTDNGRLDGDKVWDRAVGPMQFIPSTWRWAGRDGDGDGVADPNDLDDAALAAAGYLCPAYGSILPESAMRAAIFRYNQSDYYVDLVMAFEEGYRTGVFVIPSPPVEEEPEEATPDEPGPGKGKGQGAAPATSAAPAPGPGGQPGGKDDQGKTGPGKGGPATGQPGKGDQDKGGSTTPPAPTPSTPPAPKLVAMSGALAACGAGWCLGGSTLDLGPAAQLQAPAPADLDGDGAVESTADELAGLAGTSVQMLVGAGTDPAVVYEIAGKPYRNADGSFR